MSFTTVEDAALALNRLDTSLTPLELAQLEALILQVDGVINDYCGWNMLATTFTNKRFDGSGTDTLDLKVCTINSLTVVKERLLGGEFNDITTSIEILDDGIIRFLPEVSSTFTTGTKNYFLTYNAGYPEGSIPSGLTWAANYLININFGKITNESVGLKSNKNTNIDVVFDSIELPVLVARTLDRYRLISLF